MKRYHDEIGRIRREHRRHLRWAHGWPQEPVLCPCDQQAGRFRKRKALDCGHARCLLCHGNKLLGIATHKDRLADLRFTESLREVSSDLGLAGADRHGP